jgi:hypothetical protein
VPEHGVAGEQRALRDEGQVVGRVARRGDRMQRTERVTVAEPHVGAGEARAGHGRPAGPPAQLRGGRDVVVVVVRDGDAADPAPVGGVGQHRVDVGVEGRPRVHDPARAAADQPRVRALQREGPGVVGLHLRDVQAGERVHRRSVNHRA